MHWAVAAVVLCGCDYLFNLERVGPSGPPIDAPPGEICFGHDPHVICIDAPLTTGVQQVPSLIDTTMCTSIGGTLTQTESDTRVLCVLAAEGWSAASVRVGGDYPLVLFATRGIDVTGAIDAGSHNQSGGGQGPGARQTGCTAGDGGGTLYGTGGAGASFAAAGGSGGAANATGGLTPSSPIVPLDGIRGGCRGGNGGNGGTNVGGGGGAGGGAVYFVANEAIAIGSNGAILVGGEGGNNGATNAGGGGGGSGGLIMLDAPIVSSLGVLCANGGGGGGGGSGARGVDACTNGIAQAAGGIAGATGVAGGLGSRQEIPPTGKNGASGTAMRSGGGGGGAGGYVRIVSPMPSISTQQTSPPAT